MEREYVKCKIGFSSDRRESRFWAESKSGMRTEVTVVEGADAAGREVKLRALWERIPFHALCELRVVQWTPGRVAMRCLHRSEITNGAGTVHGGVITSLIDAAAIGAVIAGRDLDDRRVPATTSLSANFLRPASDDVTATAMVTRRGRSTCFVTVSVAGASGQTVAEGIVAVQLA